MSIVVRLLPFKSIVKNENDELGYRVFGLNTCLEIKTTPDIIRTFEYLLLYTLKNYIEIDDKGVNFELDIFKQELIKFNLDIKNFIEDNYDHTTSGTSSAQLLDFLPHNLLECWDVILKVLEHNDCECILANEINYNISKTKLNINGLDMRERFSAIWNAIDEKVFYRPSILLYQNLIPILFQFYFLIKHKVSEDMIANKIGVFIKYWIHLNSDPLIPNTYMYIEKFIQNKFTERKNLFNKIKNIYQTYNNTNQFSVLHLPRSYDRVANLNFERLYEIIKRDLDLQQQRVKNADKLANWYSKFDNLIIENVQSINTSGMTMFVREMLWYIIYTTIRYASDVHKLQSHTNWMIVYTIRKFQMLTKSDIGQVAKDIIENIFTCPGEAITNQVVLDWMKNDKMLLLFNIINEQIQNAANTSAKNDNLTTVVRKRCNK